FADTHGREPSSSLSDPDLPGDLVRADAFLGAVHQVDDEQPFPQRNLALFEDGPHADGKLLVATPALPQPLAYGALALALSMRSELVRFVHRTAVRADRAGWPEK